MKGVPEIVQQALELNESLVVLLPGLVPPSISLKMQGCLQMAVAKMFEPSSKGGDLRYLEFLAIPKRVIPEYLQEE